MKHITILPIALIVLASQLSLANNNPLNTNFSGLYIGGNIGIAGTFDKTTFIKADKPKK